MGDFFIGLLISIFGIIIIAIVIILMTTKKKTVTTTPSTPTTPTKKTNFLSIFLKIIVVIAIILVVIIFFPSIFNGCKKEIPKDENIPQISNKENTVVNIGKTKTLYRFADYPNGKITKYLNREAEWYPKGGKIKYKTSSGKILTDEPGSAHYNEPEPPGNFTFWADDQSAWGVEIWE